jgi:hypothetical protein
MMMFFGIMPLPVQWCILPVSARRRPVGFAASTQSIYIGTDKSPGSEPSPQALSCFRPDLRLELAFVRRNFVATMPTLDRVRQSCDHCCAVSLGVFTFKMKYQSPLGLLKPFRGR